MQFRIACSAANRLKSHGHAAYLVGGCVRDLLLGRPVKDYDIATAATPDEVCAIHPYSKLVGEKFGVVLVNIQNDEEHGQFEVATFRKEGAYDDKRRPSHVSFTTDFKEDSNRRDFTMNAIYMVPDTEALHTGKQFQDPHGGLKDVHDKIIRCVGDPVDRFTEDALRMMRAVRFVSQLGFELHEDTEKAISKLAWTITCISQERITEEFRKLMVGDNCVRALEIMVRTNLLQHVCPELHDLIDVEQGGFHNKCVWNHTLDVLRNLQGKGYNELTMFGALFHDIGKPATKQPKGDRFTFLRHEQVGADIVNEILPRMKFPSNLTYKISRIVYLHMRLNQSVSGHVIRRMIYEAQNQETLDALMLVMEADGMAHVLTEERIEFIKNRNKLIPSNPIFSPVLPIDGFDIKEIGGVGPEIAYAKYKVLEFWFKKPTLGTKEALGCAKSAILHHRSKNSSKLFLKES